MRKEKKSQATVQKKSRHWRAAEEEVALDSDTGLSYVIPSKGLILWEPCLKICERIGKKGFKTHTHRDKLVDSGKLGLLLLWLLIDWKLYLEEYLVYK